MVDGDRDQVERQQGDKRRWSHWLEHGVQNARQWMQPPAYRIAAPTQDENTQQSTANMNHSEQSKTVEGISSSPEEQLTSAMKTLAAVATAVWRAKDKLDEDAQGSLPSELRHLPRHIQAAWDALAAGQIEIEDMTGQRYVPGMAVNVLTFQPLEGIGCETIHETIKPAVYCNDKLIQRSDIIVARPAQESETDAGQPTVDDDGAASDETPSDKKGSETHGPDND